MKKILMVMVLTLTMFVNTIAGERIHREHTHDDSFGLGMNFEEMLLNDKKTILMTELDFIWKSKVSDEKSQKKYEYYNKLSLAKSIGGNFVD